MNRVRAAVIACALCAASRSAHADDDDPFDAATVSIQVGGGLLTGAILGAGCGLIGAGIGQLIDPHNWGVPLAGAVLAGVAGATVGIVIGVDYAGDERGANGTVLGTALGLGGGTIVLGTFQTLAARARWRVPTSVNVLVGLVTLVGGPIVGYHLTADRNGGQSKVQVPVAGFVF